MKYFVFILFLVSNLKSSAISFPEFPLNAMIERAEFISRERVVKIEDIDAEYQKELKSVLSAPEFDLKKAHCGYCKKMATFVIEKNIKGELKQDSIQIAFHSSYYHWIPGFTEGKEYILFLGKLIGFDVYAKQDPRFGTKSAHLDEYEDAITRYLALTNKKEKREWGIELCTNQKLSWDVTKNFEYHSASQFSDREKEILYTGLIKMDFNMRGYRDLLLLVSKFGKDDLLIRKCLDRLSRIAKKDLVEGEKLIEAIAEMIPKEEYKTKFEKFRLYGDERLNDQETFELIREFYLALKKKV